MLESSVDIEIHDDSDNCDERKLLLVFQREANAAKGEEHVVCRN